MQDWLRSNAKNIACFAAVGGVLMGLSVLVGIALVSSLGLSRTVAFPPQYTITLIVGYFLHGNSTCRDKQLCWKTNGPRWAMMRVSQLTVGFAISVLFLHVGGLSYQAANQAAGLLVGIPTYPLIRRWVLAGERREATA
jgi:putative flippase GtrA